MTDRRNLSQINKNEIDLAVCLGRMLVAGYVLSTIN